MQEFMLTHKVDSHHTNPNYKCLLVNLLGKPEVHYDIIVRDGNGKILHDVYPELTRLDWMPKTEHLMRIIQRMYAWKPTEFGKSLNIAVTMGDLEGEDWK